VRSEVAVRCAANQVESLQQQLISAETKASQLEVTPPHGTSWHPSPCTSLVLGVMPHVTPDASCVLCVVCREVGLPNRLCPSGHLPVAACFSLLPTPSLSPEQQQQLTERLGALEQHQQAQLATLVGAVGLALQ
jgi:hypothetical protein